MGSVAQYVGADSALDSGLERRLSDAYRAFPARNQNDSGGRAVLEFVYLALNIDGECFLDIDARVVVSVFGELPERLERTRRVGCREGLQTEGLEAHDGVSAADNRNFKHSDHAAFPG